MRKFKILLWLIPLMAVLWTCRHEWNNETISKEELTTKTARQWYEQTQPGVVQYRQVQSSSRLKSSGDDRPIINVPLWNKAKVYKKDHVSWVEMDIASNWHHSIGPHPKGMHNTISRYIVHRNMETGKTQSFVMTIVLDSAYMLKPNLNKRISRIHFCEVEKEFSGMLLYSLPNGRFIVGHKYKNGEHTANLYMPNSLPRSSLKSSSTSDGECYDDEGETCDVVSDPEIYKTVCLGEAVVTGTFCPIPSEPDYCDAWYADWCICYGVGCYDPFDPNNPDDPNSDPCSLYYDPCLCDGDCGGGSTYNPPPPPPPPPPTDPCSNGTAANGINNSMMGNADIQSKMDAVLKSKMSDAYEWAVSVSKSENSYNVSNPGTDYAGSVTIPAFLEGDPYAAGHNHTENGDGVPSGGDVYSLLSYVSNYPTFQTFYVYGKGWGGATEVYAMNVYDRNAALTFLNQYPKNTNLGSNQKFTGTIGTAYTQAVQDYNAGKYNASGISYPYMSDAVALSLILNKYNMGITLSRKVDNEPFKTISATNQVSGGTTTINISNCD